jgi:hypothetical protein
MKRSWILAAGTCVTMLGCATIPPGAERGPDGTMAYDVLIEASEPGARIEANGELLGNAPLHLKIFGDPDGTFHDFGSDFYVIRALPVATNQYPQVRWFGTGRWFGPEDHIPERIYFDMNQPPPPMYAPGGPLVYLYPDYGPPAYYHFYYGAPYYYGPRYYYPGPYYRPGLRYYQRPSAPPPQQRNSPRR